MEIKENFLKDSIRKFRLVFFLVLLFCVVSGSNELIYAQSCVIIKKVDDSLKVDGVVASGAAMDDFTVDAVWQEVDPVEFLLSDSSPKAYLYLAYHQSNNRLFIGIVIFGDEDLSDQDNVYLLFDADNDNTWNAGDFYIKVVVSPSTSKIISGTLCDQATGIVQYYKYGASGWEEVTVSGVASEVNSKAAYDYDNTDVDPEEKIWNLEIDMPIGQVVDSTTYFDLQTTSPYFGIGAYIFVDDGHKQTPQEGPVMKWPSSMEDRSITQQNMGGRPSSESSDLGDASLDDICYDVNFNVNNPWEINPDNQDLEDNRIIGDQSNTFRVTFYFDGPGEDAESLPSPNTNTGVVTLKLRPYGTGAGGSTYDWIESQPVTCNVFNRPTTVEFKFDFANPPTELNWSEFSQIDFVCATMTLESFSHDENSSNNDKTVNYNYLKTSRYKHKFFVFGDLPTRKSGESTTMLLHFQSNNEIQKVRNQLKRAPANKSPGYPGFFSIIVLLVAVVIFIVLVRITRKASKRKRLIIVPIMIILIVIVFIVCRDCWKSKPDQVGTDRWEVPNAEQLGIEPVQNKPGWYKMPFKSGEIKTVELDFKGIELPYKTERHRLKPAKPCSMGPNILQIPVKYGDVISVFAFGQIDLDGPGCPLAPTSPTGFVFNEAVDEPFLLNSSYRLPHQNAGALIGSFDNFETSFVVGRNSSIVVPVEAAALYLAVNSSYKTYLWITGEYELYTMVTPFPRVPTHIRLTGEGTFQNPYTLPSWQVLTSLNIYTYYQTEQFGEDGTLLGRTMHPWGFVHYTIYDTHVGGESPR